MDFEIKMKDEVYDEIYTLMDNIEELNKGKEIAGWLLGDWKTEDDKLVLELDEFIIPSQEVSGVEVDIDENSMIDTIKEYGPEKCNRIKAHWHIHPFGKGSTTWSGTDETKIKKFMEPEKDRELFVFLLSSEDEIKARVEVNVKATILGNQHIVRESYDDLDVIVESKTNSTIFNKLKNRIKDKVVYPTKTIGTSCSSLEFDDYKGYYSNFKPLDSFIEQYEDKDDSYFPAKESYIVAKDKDGIVIKTSQHLGEFMLDNQNPKSILTMYDDIEVNVNGYNFIYLRPKKEIEDLFNLIKKEMEDFYYEFTEIKLEEDYADWGTLE
jgi:hypothetical protein